MRKIISLAFSSLALLMSSCGSTATSPSFDGNKLTLESSDYGTGEFVEFDSYNDFANKMSSGDHFVLYFYNLACSHCAAFSPIVEAFIRDENIRFYRLSSNLDELATISPYIPSIIAFSDNEVFVRLDPESDADSEYFTNVMNFRVWFTTYINLEP